MHKFISLVLAAFAASLASQSEAQISVIQAPPQPPATVTPKPGGGYIMKIPGDGPADIKQTSNGGFIIKTPGHPPVKINPVSGGGYKVEKPRE
jgi:hypothetical protein